MTTGYHVDIEQKALANEHFREVLFTAAHSQLVVMTLQPSEEIGSETHTDRDQFIRVESGAGKAILNGVDIALVDGVAIIISAGIEHNVINTSPTEPLKLYTIYSPSEHPAGTIHKTKHDADEYERYHHE